MLLPVVDFSPLLMVSTYLHLVISLSLLKKHNKNKQTKTNSIYFLSFWWVLFLSTKPIKAWYKKQNKEGEKEKKGMRYVWIFFFHFFQQSKAYNNHSGIYGSISTLFIANGHRDERHK